MSKRYLPVDLHHIRRGQWLAYITDLDLVVTATNSDAAKRETRRLIEETEGEHDFEIIWAHECG